MKAQLVKENIENILVPKTEEELSDVREKVDMVMYRLQKEFEKRYPENPIRDFNYFFDGGGINLTIEFQDNISDQNLIEDILYPYPQVSDEVEVSDEFPYPPHFEEDYPEIEHVETNIVNVVFPLSIVTESWGGGGAGYAVWGGGTGRNFGNPSMRGGFAGRGFGFGGSMNLSGGPNLMYTYAVKPLNTVLQQQATPQDDEQYIHVGNKIKGKILNTNKDIEGSIIRIEEDEDNNIKWYIVLDKEGRKRKVDPTSAYLDEPEQIIDPNVMDMANESFYPNLYERLTHEEATKDVEEKVKRSKKLPQEIKDKIYPLIVPGETEYREGRVFRLKYPKSKGCDLGADKNGFFVFTHRARSKSKEDIDKIPEKDIKFIKSTG